ncbi:type II toxin-antitoxin system VapC family toxin [uncultured Paracoccus sp.]|jgi:predicted nucleic acid-binding protein|uniref:type II toxin-antitoxin system VapC family toxin n=1 Tax=uncultured Paracoccus sp. TaxID=189685 RepID=UPI0026352CAA|nr:type II toxin-antitoxin system VapC family toxin [uncultured Paracoccus sp.]|tara:strand:- start:531 stop:920 length:390 start_codon:yes stop_codon:yes gene_type:complete
MIAIDTNIVVRYLTGDHPEQSNRAREIVDGQPVLVPVTVVLETEWVLRSAYGYNPADVVRALRAFGGLPEVTIQDAAILSAAFNLTEHGMDFADALHLGLSEEQDALLTFDRRFVKAAKSAGSSFVKEA